MTRSIVAGLLVLFAVPAVRPADEDNPAKEALQALNEYIATGPQWSAPRAATGLN